MGEKTDIAWCDSTFNPWIGCQRVSPGCEHCYAESQDSRWHPKDGHWGPKAQRERTSTGYWTKPLQWNKKAEKLGVRARVFCASLADIFEDRAELSPWRADLFRLISQTSYLDWLLLTKRPQNADGAMYQAARDAFPGRATGDLVVWPDNVWLGTTVEDQRRAEERIPALLATDAVLKFLSVEPQIEAVDLDLGRCDDHGRKHVGALTFEGGHQEEGCTECAADGWSGELSVGHWLNPLNGGIGWVIQGGESGPGARVFDVAWARQTAAQCEENGVAYFLKQLGRMPKDGDKPLKLNDSHGGDMAEWPEDLRALGRAFPAVKR